MARSAILAPKTDLAFSIPGYAFSTGKHFSRGIHIWGRKSRPQGLHSIWHIRDDDRDAIA
jgi:hypothetical protein